jgi:hypothetical protein
MAQGRIHGRRSKPWPIRPFAISDQGFDIPPREQQTPEWLGMLHKAEIEKWWPIIKAANIKGE